MHERGSVFARCLQSKQCALVCVAGVLLKFELIILVHWCFKNADEILVDGGLFKQPHEKEVARCSQPEDACHLLKEEDRPRKEDIEKMCSEGYFTKYATQSIYSEEEGYEDISHFQEKGCSFKFLFSMILSGTYSNPFHPFENLFSCHVPVHRPRCVVMPPLINNWNKFWETTPSKMWVILVSRFYRSMV